MRWLFPLIIVVLFAGCPSAKEDIKEPPDFAIGDSAYIHRGLHIEAVKIRSVRESSRWGYKYICEDDDGHLFEAKNYELWIREPEPWSIPVE